MAKNDSSRMGGVLGVIVGVVILGGLVGTPFYLNTLVADSQKLDNAVEEPVEQLRRVLLNLDESLAAMSDLYGSPGQQDQLNQEAIDDLLAKKPDIIAQSSMKDLERSSQLLRQIDNEDQKRGTFQKGAARIPTGRPNISSSVALLRSRYLSAHKKLLRQAKEAMHALQTATSGHADAAHHLGMNRIKAIFYYAKGRLAQNRAEFEQGQAAALRRQAVALSSSVAELLNAGRSLSNKTPENAIKQINEMIAEKDKKIAGFTQLGTQLSALITTGEARAAKLDTEAEHMRGKMIALGTSGDPIHDENGQYARLSDKVRKAVAQAAALRHGTLQGATLDLDGSQDMLSAPYQGGRSIPGLDSLKTQSELITQQLALLEKAKASLSKQKSTYENRSERIAEHIQSNRALTKEASEKISQLLDRADSHLKPAEQASKAAIKVFHQAERFAKAAASAAAKRVRDAKSASAEAKGLQADRLKMITNDHDMEAAMHCLAAEISYHMALTLAQRIDALQMRVRSGQFVTTLLGQPAPDSREDQTNDLRNEATDHVAAALKAYQVAGRLIKKTKTKTDRGTIQGKDYLWQIKIGQAAVHLLHAALLDDAESAYAQKTAAYDLLAEAAQGREQSPLLTPAIDTLAYLQKSTK